MAYPAGFSSDEDELDGFLSDDSDDLNAIARAIQGEQQEFTPEQKLRSVFLAIINGDTERVLDTLNDGLDVNVVLREGWTPLMLAVSIGNVNLTSELISRGADVNADKDKYTILMAACSCPESTAPPSNCLDIVTQLIEKGANVNAITKTRKTALMFAASNGNAQIVAKLLSCSNINAEDNQGWNALFWAVCDNKPQIVQMLLDAGLNPNKIDIRGNTAVHYAISEEFEDIVKLLVVPVDNTISTMQEYSYDFEELFENLKPQFFRDICCMLYGMKSENLIHHFTDVSLSDFLSMNNSKLIELGITIPYQRNRILTGLHKFHKHIFKQMTIPVVQQNSVYSTIDTSIAITASVRQLIAMEADLKYITSSRITTIEDKKSLCISVRTIKNKIARLKKTATALHNLTKKWDASNQPVDLIRNTTKKSNRWVKWFGCTTILLCTSIIISKIRQPRSLC